MKQVKVRKKGDRWVIVTGTYESVFKYKTVQEAVNVLRLTHPEDIEIVIER